MPIKKITKNCILLTVLLIGGSVFNFNFAMAQSCPSVTTVNGTSVTFSGELTDMGGDTVTYVWFEYGQTSSLGQKTSEQSLTNTGLYCVTVSDLNPSTTYYYRAGARNAGGTSYGEIKSFTTGAVEQIPDFSIEKTVRNLSDGTIFSKTVLADPGEILTFRIKVKAGNSSISNVIVKDTLPNGIIYEGDLRIDNVLVSGDIVTGINIGNLTANQEKIITFQSAVRGAENFPFGQTTLTNTSLVSSGATSRSDTAQIIVSKVAVAGAATAISTGLTNNILIDSFLLPLMIALLIVWVFKARIIKFEEWLDNRKKEHQIYKSNKILQMKIAQIKNKELWQGENKE
jgi:uncharacterized repeat protein (TIGR01451 family)